MILSKLKVLSHQIIPQFHYSVIKYSKLFLYSDFSKSFLQDQSDLNVKALGLFVQGILLSSLLLLRNLLCRFEMFLLIFGILSHFHFEFIKILLKNVENDVQFIIECAQVKSDFMDKISEIIEFHYQHSG
jgi:hypothetical protein